MLEVQEERPAAAATATATHFSKKERERARKEREEGKDGRSLGPGTGPRTGRAKSTGLAAHTHTHTHTHSHAHTHSPHQHLSPPIVALGSPSMHSSNPKVRNSPTASTQSPKSKQEVMVRSPPVMSPSSAAQMESKLPNQGKQGGAASQSLPSPCDSKTLGGCHGPKGAPGGGPGLKNGQGLNAGSKVKLKRERSTSLESFEQRDAATPNNDAEPREGSRAKRMCVSERRQPYSGADWCSGGESDEDEQGLYNCSSGDLKPQDTSSHPASNPALSRSSTPSHNAMGGQSASNDPSSAHKPKVVYVYNGDG